MVHQYFEYYVNNIDIIDSHCKRIQQNWKFTGFVFSLGFSQG